jgi:hypothetical protein
MPPPGSLGTCVGRRNASRRAWSTGSATRHAWTPRNAPGFSGFPGRPRLPDRGRRGARDHRGRRDAYLAAIGELGCDEEAAAKLWRDGVDGRTRALLDFQGRKPRGRIEELGLTIGDLAERTVIDTARLVAVLFGQEEMGAIEWTGLSEALDVQLDWVLEGVRFVPRTSPDGRGFYEIEPAEGESAEATHPSDHPSDGLGGDPR